MKIILIIIGSCIALLGAIRFFYLVFSYNKLLPYAKGYVWGNAILIIVGLLIVFFTLRKRKAPR